MLSLFELVADSASELPLLSADDAADVTELIAEEAAEPPPLVADEAAEVSEDAAEPTSDVTDAITDEAPVALERAPPTREVTEFKMLPPLEVNELKIEPSWAWAGC
jgi:hypothetical protein